MEKHTQVPDGWRLVRLEDVSDFQQGGTPSKGNAEYWGGHVPFLTGADLREFYIGRNSARSFLTNKGLNSGATAICDRGALLLATRTRVGLTGIATETMGVSQDITVLSASDLADPFYLCRILMRHATLLRRRSRGTTIQGVSREDVASLPVLLPPLPEQRAIVAVLDSIDEAIEAAEAVIAATERVRVSLLHELISRGVPGWHSEWKEVRNLGRIPARWEVVRLEDVADVQTGRAVNRKADHNGSLEIPYLSVANVKDGYLDLGVVKTMLVSEVDVERFRLREGDVLFTEGGDADKLGRGTVWHGEIPVCLHQNHIFAVRPYKHVAEPKFLSAFAASSPGKRYFLSAAKQTTNLASVNSTQLKRMPVPLPSLREQAMIVKLLSVCEDAIEQERTERRTLNELKAATADALLSGRLRVFHGMETRSG